MAARAIWKGYLRLSLVNCAVALFPASTEGNRIHFHKINRDTGNRLRMRMVDEETGEEVPSESQAKGYEITKGESVIIEREDLDEIRLESNHILEIAHFVPRDEIDPLYFDKPYFLAPEDDPSQEAFLVIREAMRAKSLAAISKLVMHDREHMVLLEPRGVGIMATILRWPYEVRNEETVFGAIPRKAEISPDMLEVAGEIVERRMGHFDPSAFEDHYEEALTDLIRAKQAGKAPKPVKAPTTTVPSSIFEALKASLRELDRAAPAPRRSPAGRPARPPARQSPSTRKTVRR
jgi:DNA end-binding protein Ku